MNETSEILNLELLGNQPTELKTKEDAPFVWSRLLDTAMHGNV